MADSWTMADTMMSEVRRLPFAELTTDELYRILRLRSDVFVVEQECAYPDLDGRDTEPGTIHWWMESGSKIQTYARSMLEPDGTVRIGRVVTAPTARGGGLAKTLMETILRSVEPGKPFVLDAQSYLADWYGALGFEPTGPEFIEDGIPHIPMRRD